MELPFNTTISKDLLQHGGRFDEPVAQVVDEAALGGGGVRGARARRLHHRQRLHGGEGSGEDAFLYRDRLWQGADMVGLGVASFGHVNGVHLQNVDTWEAYSAAIDRGEIPLGRAYRPTTEERMIREFVLQLKRGSRAAALFPRASTASSVLERFRDQLTSLEAVGLLAPAGDGRDRHHPRSAAARRHAAAAVLPAAAHGDSVYVGSGLRAQGSGDCGSQPNGRVARRAMPECDRRSRRER